MKKFCYIVALMLVIVFPVGSVSAQHHYNTKLNAIPQGMSPTTTVWYYHLKITDGDLDLAYCVLTDDYEKYFKSYLNFEEGYATTIISRPYNIHLLAMSDTDARVGYNLLARDWLGDCRIMEQNFECEAQLKKVDGVWMLDNCTGKLVDRHEYGRNDSAVMLLKTYHECITHGELKAAWHLLGEKYKEYFGNFFDFSSGFENTVSSEATDIQPVADSLEGVNLRYTLTSKDVTQETDVVQVFDGFAQLEVTDDNRWRIVSAENKLVDQYFPPKR